MTITVLTNTATPPRVIQRSPLLARVMAWELRRFCASRLFWVQALGFFGFSLFLTWALHAPVNFPQVSNGVQFTGFVAGTSAWGLLLTLPFVLVVLVLLLPLITPTPLAPTPPPPTHTPLHSAA